MNAGSIHVDVKGLSVKFGSFTAVDDISFQVKRGEIFGFLGANGAGKTTTIRVLCGLILPSAGKVIMGGESIEESPMKIKAKVGYMSQRFTLYSDMTVEENLSFAAALRKLDKSYYQKRSEDLLKFIGFSVPLKTLVKDLPSGIMQQIALTAAVLHDPEIVFLDEPTAGVTPAFRDRFWKLIKGFSSQGKTVFVTTHYMDEAEQCDRVALMRAGRIIAIDTPSDLKKKTFPEPIYELEVTESERNGWIEEVRSREFVESVEPYGLRFHVTVKNRESWERYLKESTVKHKVSPIEPTLEDVFIRLVEGKDR